MGRGRGRARPPLPANASPQFTPPPKPPPKGPPCGGAAGREGTELNLSQHFRTASPNWGQQLHHVGSLPAVLCRPHRDRHLSHPLAF